ncbi:MAG TPA: hypothetical protein VFG90_00330 [Nitrososphaeraceae archaeon]|nr:hypothetical protein [Nitrososphaeraceae archaeon]
MEHEIVTSCKYYCRSIQYNNIIRKEEDKTFPKIIMPVIRAFILNEHNTGQMNANFV